MELRHGSHGRQSKVNTFRSSYETLPPRSSTSFRQLQITKGVLGTRPHLRAWEEDGGTHVSDLAEGSHRRAAVIIFLPGHVFCQAAVERKRTVDTWGPGPSSSSLPHPAWIYHTSLLSTASFCSHPPSQAPGKVTELKTELGTVAHICDPGTLEEQAAGSPRA